VFISDYLLEILLFFLFVLGTIVGSLLNVCIYRLPLEKSILWPGSRCGGCVQPIRWYDNIPLISYLWLRGRCRSCGATFSMRYFWVELFTGLAFVGLFYLEIVANVHNIDALRFQKNHIQNHVLPSPVAMALFGYHALLVCLLIVASVCDLDHHEIPLSLTVTGAILGLIGAVLLAWPWPYTPALAVARIPPGREWWEVNPDAGPKMGVFPWPFWGPLPSWFEPGGNWQTGLATGLIGLTVGTVMLRVVRFLFGKGLGVEALGLGDADLMMMAGSFLGWQPVVIAFLVASFPALFFALLQRVYQAFALRRSTVFEARLLLKDGQPALQVDGQATPLEQAPAVLAAMVKEKGKAAMYLESAKLGDWIDQTITDLSDTARRAGFANLRTQYQKEEPPGWLGRMLQTLWSRLGWKPRAAVKITARREGQQLTFAVDGQAVTKDRLAAILNERAKTVREAWIDATELEQWLDKLVRSLRYQAKEAGVVKIHTPNNAIPFGPGLAVGLVVVMLGWHWIGPAVQFVLFNRWFLFGITAACCVLLFVLSYLMRMLRLLLGG
jgi:leader peptidase (prepilin peptidase)/N-methyltransferase